MSNLILPRTYQDKTPDGKYSMHNNKPKLSYSQISSWKSPEYFRDYIKQYFAGIKLNDSIYATFGSACGTYIESIGINNPGCHDEYKHLLSEFDRETLRHQIEYPENSVYEDLIVVDCGDFVIEGFADRVIYNLLHNSVEVEDFKTGSIAKKRGQYASSDYMQTNLYAYAKENEGYTIKNCSVIMLDRAGNNSSKSPIRLTGKTEIVPTPYNREKTELFLEGVIKIAQDISNHYKTYIKYFG